MRSRHTRPNRRAYTLVEILIATLLMATLMGTIYGLFSLYTGFLKAGRSQAQRQQLVRSIADMLSADVKQVSRTDERPDLAATATFINSVSEGSDTAFGTMNFNNSDPLGFERSDGVTQLPALGITGTDSSLHLVIRTSARSHSTPQRITRIASQESAVDRSGRSLLAGSDQAPNVPELLHVIYFFEAPGTIAGPADQVPTGLHRLEASWMDLVAIEGSSASAAADAQLFDPLRRVIAASLNPSLPSPRRHAMMSEVVRCRFRYFDGSTWQSEWAASRDQLPDAVKIEFEVVSAADAAVLNTVLNKGTYDEETFNTSSTAGQEITLDPFEQFERTYFQHVVLLGHGRSRAEDSLGAPL